MRYPHIRQHDEKDCAAACLSMISEFYGLKLPLASFREQVRVDCFGANILGIVSGAEALGFAAEALEGDGESLLQAARDGTVTAPFIARILNEEGFDHFVVVYALRANTVLLGDPGKLRVRRIPLASFLAQWQGQIITLRPGEGFTPGNQRRGTLRRYFDYIARQKKALLLILLCSLLISGISLFSASAFQFVVDDVITVGDVDGAYAAEAHEHDHDHEAADAPAPETTLKKAEALLTAVFQNLETVCGVILALYLLRSLLQLLRGTLLARIAREIDVSLLTDCYDHLTALPLPFFGARRTGEILSRFSDASSIRAAVSNATLTILLDTFMAVFAGVYLFVLNHTLFWITLGVLTVYGAIMALFRRPIRGIHQDVMERSAQLTSSLKESVDGMETIKAFGAEAASRKKTHGLLTAFADRVLRGAVIGKLQEVLVSLVESVGMVLLLWAGAYLCVERVITIGALLSFYYLLDYFLEPVKNLIELQPTLQTAIVSAERLNDVLDARPERTDSEAAQASPEAGDIALEDVTFRYGYREAVLRHITMRIPRGSTVAIVGESGCGKTTMARLLMRFYDPESGRITVGGQALDQISPGAARRRTAYVSQDTALFSDTILNNLRMGDETISEEEAARVCALCRADDFIRAMPMGYHTMLEENGANLSGGQKQRLAIARALLRKPEVLILDEATSNLDTITEAALQDTLRACAGEMTVIVIAHRLRTVQSCDEIFVMRQGEIAEQGTHEALLRRGGLYASYWSAC